MGPMIGLEKMFSNHVNRYRESTAVTALRVHIDIPDRQWEFPKAQPNAESVMKKKQQLLALSAIWRI